MSFTRNKFFLSFLSALLLTLSWQKNLSLFSFIAFIPLLLIEHELSGSTASRKKLKIFGFAYFTFLLWNIGVTWWVYYASAEGSLMAFFPNALLMSIAFLIFSNVKSRIKNTKAIWLFVPFWLAFEYGHSVWDLAWIWLNLGNVFCYNTSWVQWYEFTGVSGGSLWILCTNVYLFQLLIHNQIKQKKSQLIFAGILILPVLFSFVILNIRRPLQENKKTAVIVQPNIDPYNEKFDLDYQAQFLKMLRLIEGKINQQSDYLVLPETFITGIDWYGVNENNLNNAEEILWFKDSLLSKYPNLNIIVGASSYYVYENEKEASVTARRDKAGTYFDCFNTAFLINAKGVQLYHKSKLVPGVERMPFPALFKPLEEFAIDLGGTTGSLGTQKQRSNLYDLSNIGIAPVVCYESVFSDYVSDYIRNTADFIFIITNDGWWSDSPGHIQHLNYARLRAIETRRQIARSANTGISCVIDEFGNIHQATKYWEEAVISSEIYPNKKLTFFSSMGDLISYASIVLTFMALLFSFYLKFIKRT
ncbi:MAG: apolipoprotein N-acyltransferase [Sphingobacteriaceae bacterium]|nr:apolipoprotein N-acyltransferase [Sphingobacteriaceae bacterium]